MKIVKMFYGRNVVKHVANHVTTHETPISSLIFLPGIYGSTLIPFIVDKNVNKRVMNIIFVGKITGVHQ